MPGSGFTRGAAYGRSAVSLYQTQKFLYHLNRDPALKAQFDADRASALENYELQPQERTALVTGDIGLLYVLGVNGQILMHFAAHLGIAWFDYLALMRAGVATHGPVRAGIYAMTGDGKAFTAEDAAP